MRKCLVIVLDGISPSITLSLSEIFDSIEWFKRRYQWRIIHINQPPTTPSVLMTAFTGLEYEKHKIWWFDSIKYGELISKYKFIWDEAEKAGLKTVVSPIPICWKPICKNFKLLNFKSWELVFPSRDEIFETADKLHKLMLLNIRRDWNLFIAYYPIPDKLYHVTPYGVTTWEQYTNMVKAYGLAFKYAKELIDKSSYSKWIILGDHGYLCPCRYIEKYRHYRRTMHTPETVFISNISPPKNLVEVYDWIKRCLRVA